MRATRADSFRQPPDVDTTVDAARLEARATRGRLGLIVLALLATALLSAQSNPVADGIAAFNRGDYKAARQHLERTASDPRGPLFLALTKAATGECEGAV